MPEHGADSAPGIQRARGLSDVLPAMRRERARVSRRAADPALAAAASINLAMTVAVTPAMPAATLDDWFAIHQLFVAYATALDACDVDGVIACFEPDCTLSSPVLGRFEGHAGLRDFVQRTVDLKRERNAQFRHVVSNLRAWVDGDRAVARCYLLDFLTESGRTELLSPGEY